MATLNQPDPKAVTAPPQRSCIACTEADIQLIRPCRTCETDYCVDCLVDMFVSATHEADRMPPHCCHLIQIHTILAQLTSDQAKAYRAKFEEYITPVKTYCPSPTCSAFISEKRVPTIMERPTTTPSLLSILGEVVANVAKAPPARFFRGEMDITMLPGYTVVVTNPMDLSMIQDQLSMSMYTSTNQLTKDMTLIVSNAKHYNGTSHPVADAADELFAKYLEELSNATDRLMSTAATSTASPIFSCPKCRLAICTRCKQTEHFGSPCDTSSTDHEIAMLEQFGYKRCPRCKAGVKKMFGCSHMRCMCGAHWCYWCQRSIEQCNGACEERDYEDNEDEDDYDSEVDEEEEEDAAVRAAVVAANRTSQPPPRDAGQTGNAASNSDHALVNLDAGGGRRWADGNLDFGEEPEETSFSQIWSCEHKFQSYEIPPEDEFNRGDHDRMECNRCFAKVEGKNLPSTAKTPKKRLKPFSQKSRKESSSATESSPKSFLAEMEAWECSRCHVLVCVRCRDKYRADQGNE